MASNKAIQPKNVYTIQNFNLAMAKIDRMKKQVAGQSNKIITLKETIGSYERIVMDRNKRIMELEALHNHMVYEANYWKQQCMELKNEKNTNRI